MEGFGDFFQAYSTTIALIGINALLALSVWVTLYAGQLTLGNAAFMGLAAYASALLTLRLHLPFLPALIAGALFSGALAVPLGIPVLRLRGVYLAIATIGFGEMVRVMLLALPITGRGLGLNGIPAKTELWHVYLSLAICAYLLARVQGSTVGRAWAAIREDELAAASQGIAVRRYKLAAFVLGAVLAGWAGGLSAHLNYSLEPGEFGFTKAVEILVFAIVGGVPNVLGPILGATLLTALPELLRFLRDYRDFLNGAILILVIIYLPRGLVTVAELRQIWQTRRRWRAHTA
jgi:branched-chain amino acid transport system permease protein